MPRDVQIKGGIGEAPQLYEVPNATEIIPKSVFATFDGTAAVSDFFPTVQFVSDGGEIVGQVRTDSAVTAGGSASVTFAPFLRTQTTAGGALTATNARYGATTLSVAANTSGFLSLTGPSFGASLLDLTVPSSPTIVTAGVYAFCFVARVVIALGGSPTGGSGHAAAINNAGGGQNCTAFFTMPSAAGTIVPQWTATSVPAHHAAGDVIQFSITNGDGASARVYDSPSIGVVLLS